MKYGSAYNPVRFSGFLLFLLSFLAASPVYTADFDPANANYSGFEGLGQITLVNGLWEGAPYVEGGAARETVGLIEGMNLAGEAGRHGIFLWQSSGGSGVFSYLALVVASSEGCINTSTVLLGDRVQLRGAEFAGETILVHLVQAGPADPACCPSQLATRSWHVENSKLVEQAPKITGTLGPDVLADTMWQLSQFGYRHPAPSDPPLTLTYKEGKFIGSGGCNNYFATVEVGDLTGDIRVGPVASTRRACRGIIDQDEARFFQYLQEAMKLSFYNGNVRISYHDGETSDSMLFVSLADK